MVLGSDGAANNSRPGHLNLFKSTLNRMSRKWHCADDFIREAYGFEERMRKSYVRGNISRFCNKFNINGSQEKIDYTISRPSETFKELKILDDKIHALLSDDEVELDINECADYEDKTKLTIFKARKALETFKVPNIDPRPGAAISPNEAMNTSYSSFPSSYDSGISPNAPMSYIQSTIKLPTMKIEPFDGDIEKFHMFFEQFSSAVDLNQQLSTIDKHVWGLFWYPRLGWEPSLFPAVNNGKSDISQSNRGYQNRPLNLTGLFWHPLLGWETSLFPPVNDKCDSRTHFSNRLGSCSVEKRTPISRQPCTWRKRYSLVRSVVSISELIKFSFKMEAAKTLMDLMHVTSHPPTRDLPKASIGQS
ncbi:hypothetical protein AVEN_37450-1 [Araneus ventricosus]|uniref:Uncharacterized protein n=1 Tax=Araneus ventricosus TaxID=182803 RepID=A0A4Y2FAW4_ARAVE|nr:hypothetical protein AVEN_37450-1 [Araneus ventricosus]